MGTGKTRADMTEKARSQHKGVLGSSLLLRGHMRAEVHVV